MQYDPEYIKSVPAILRICEMVTCLLTFACSLGGHWSYLGGGWVEFVSFIALVWAIAWFIAYILSCVPEIFKRIPLELIGAIVFAVCLFISFIIAAARASQINDSRKGSIGAATFFALVSAILFTVDSFFLFKTFRANMQPKTTTTTGPPNTNTAHPADVAVTFPNTPNSNPQY